MNKIKQPAEEFTFCPRVYDMCIAKPPFPPSVLFVLVFFFRACVIVFSRYVGGRFLAWRGPQLLKVCAAEQYSTFFPLPSCVYPNDTVHPTKRGLRQAQSSQHSSRTLDFALRNHNQYLKA